MTVQNDEKLKTMLLTSNENYGRKLYIVFSCQILNLYMFQGNFRKAPMQPMQLHVKNIAK